MSNYNRKLEQPSLLTSILIYFGFYILTFLCTLSQIIQRLEQRKNNRAGYPPLNSKSRAYGFVYFIYEKVRHAWNYPVSSVPSSVIVLKDREFNKDKGITNFRCTDKESKCINLGSYNYLGFAENRGPCTEYAIQAIYKYGISSGASPLNYGYCRTNYELDRLIATFLGVEDALSCSMGFATNSDYLPALLSNECLVLSDEKNHTSIILGIKISGACVKVFRHNDVGHLEELLQEGVLSGQPYERVYKPWKKMLIIIEGVYSMEGTIAPLPEIIALKKKYKAYLYLDEAHSIGALGKSGRGVVEYFNCSPKDVDVHMGTYTKSFASAGGYIAGGKDLISYLRKQTLTSKYGSTMSPPVAAQIIAVLRILLEKNETNIAKKRIEILARNVQYFRRKLNQMGFITRGSDDSPVVPVLCYFYSKFTAAILMLMDHKIATVGVGYPATPMLEGRLRFCISAGHTKEQLDYVLHTFSKIGDKVGLKYSSIPKNDDPIEY
ncbi:hypothetical protein FQA39_LY02171 [Lamprigera yunnana]|nr:hypothetical protein FQA39_LY02171 [Lamprigera yunnana]